MWSSCGSPRFLLADVKPRVLSVSIECYQLRVTGQIGGAYDNHWALINMQLSALPPPISDLILEYKAEMEAYEHWIEFLNMIFNNLLWPGHVT